MAKTDTWRYRLVKLTLMLKSGPTKQELDYRIFKRTVSSPTQEIKDLYYCSAVNSKPYALALLPKSGADISLIGRRQDSVRDKG